MFTLKAVTAVSVLLGAVTASAGITYYATRTEATINLTCPAVADSAASEELLRLAREAEARRVREAEAMARFTGRAPLSTSGNPRY